MESSKIVRTAFDAMTPQRLAWSCAVIVGLFLVLIGHAPVLPVVAGCMLAIGLAALRSWPTLKAKKFTPRGGK